MGVMGASVVVGYRQEVQPQGDGLLHQFFHRVKAIGMDAVAMEVSPEKASSSQLGRPRGRPGLSQLLRRGGAPLLQLYLHPVVNPLLLHALEP